MTLTLVPEPTPDLDAISPDEAARRQLAYEADRQAYRLANPHLTREEIEERG